MKRGPKGQTRERIYRFVVEQLRKGDPPTVREVQEAFGFRAVQTARQHLENLVAEKRLVNIGGKARGYRLVGARGQRSEVRGQRSEVRGQRSEVRGQRSEARGQILRSGFAETLTCAERDREERWIAVPILGRIAAGELSMAVEDLEGYVEMMVQEGEEDLFALRVQGESMVKAGILSSDIVIVRRQSSADSGDIVVALVDDEATVKRLELREGRLELHPENPEFDVIIPEPEECRILGKVVEVRRKFQ